VSNIPSDPRDMLRLYRDMLRLYRDVLRLYRDVREKRLLMQKQVDTGEIFCCNEKRSKATGKSPKT